MASWPGTLPDDFLQQGYSETMPNNLIRTQMDAGPAKVRRRSTAAPTLIAGRQTMTETQTEALDTFFKTTTSYGADAFDWTDPRTGDSVSMRFINPPKLMPSGGVNWYVDFELEILP